jgi:hypothetical protein
VQKLNGKFSDTGSVTQKKRLKLRKKCETIKSENEMQKNDETV